MNVITLLTDFGDKDGFVGTMKGVILRINPHANIVDITHQVPRHNVEAAAFILNNSYKFFPEHTVHVAIVDPGVGGRRRAIAVQTSEYFFIAPDNHILKYIFHNEKNIKVHQIMNRNYVLKEISYTFHGRDIFAPAAAHLSLGIQIEELGPQLTDFDRGEVSVPKYTHNYIEGQIVYSDKFGNLITNIPASLIPNRQLHLQLGEYEITALSNSYSEGLNSLPLALIGSSKFLEIAIYQQSAKHKLNLKVGDTIKIKLG